MSRVVLALFALLVCLPALLAGPARSNKPPGGRRGQQTTITTTTAATAVTGGQVVPRSVVPAAWDCGPWVENPCTPPTGAVCGVGSKVWNRTGTHCPTVEKIFKCKIPCDDNAAASTKSCKYIKSPWSDCDPTTSLKTRTLTFKAKRRGPPADPACEQTKTLTKSCTAETQPTTNNNKRGRSRAHVSQP